MAKIGNIDLGVVETVEPATTKNFNVKYTGDVGSYPQSNCSQSTSWKIEGCLDKPSQAQFEALRSLQNDEVILIDIPLTKIGGYGLFGYGKVQDISFPVDNQRYGLISYSLTVQGCPAIGYTSSKTTGVYLFDLSYRCKHLNLEPHHNRTNISYSASRLQATYEFYVGNRTASVLDALLEIMVGDDILSAQLYYYNGSSYTSIATWGTSGSAWGAIVNFNDGTTAHAAIANVGNRGATVTAGTISYKLGTQKRILLKITNLTGQTTPSSIKYRSEQLKLKLVLTHSAAETGVRDYVKITYEDGSTSQGPA
jgi:hypothetical protein